MTYLTKEEEKIFDKTAKKIETRIGKIREIPEEEIKSFILISLKNLTARAEHKELSNDPDYLLTLIKSIDEVLEALDNYDDLREDDFDDDQWDNDWDYDEDYEGYYEDDYPQFDEF